MLSWGAKSVTVPLKAKQGLNTQPWRLEATVSFPINDCVMSNWGLKEQFKEQM